MTDTNLPWRVFGRQVRPFSFALSLTMAQLSWSILTKNTIGQALDGIGHSVGMAAIVALVLLFAAFWGRSDRAMVWGLLIATGVWASATTILVLDVGFTPSTMSAGCWAIAAGGAWLLEVSDVRIPRDD